MDMPAVCVFLNQLPLLTLSRGPHEGLQWKRCVALFSVVIGNDGLPVGAG